MSARGSASPDGINGLSTADYIEARVAAVRVSNSAREGETRHISAANMILETHASFIKGAADQIPRSAAHWEAGAFFHMALPCALFDLSWGLINRYQDFETLYLRLLGPKAAPWLPGLFLAAAACPSWDIDYRRRLLESFEFSFFATPDEFEE